MDNADQSFGAKSILEILAGFADPNSPDHMRKVAGILASNKKIIAVRSELPEPVVVDDSSRSDIRLPDGEKPPSGTIRIVRRQAETRITIQHLLKSAVGTVFEISGLDKTQENFDKVMVWVLAAMKRSDLILEGSLTEADATSIEEIINSPTDAQPISILRMSIRNSILKSSNIDPKLKNLLRGDKETLNKIYDENKVMDMLYERAMETERGKSEIGREFYTKMFKDKDFDPKITLDLGEGSAKLRLRDLLTEYINYSIIVIRHKVLSKEITDVLLKGVLKFLNKPRDLKNKRMANKYLVLLTEEILNRSSATLSGALQITYNNAINLQRNDNLTTDD